MANNQVNLTDRQLSEVRRIVVARHDLHQCLYCTNTILQRGWNLTWASRRRSAYAQQTVFITALVVSYGRVFTKSAGGNWISDRLTVRQFEDDEKKLHYKLLEQRDKVYAHSDMDGRVHSVFQIFDTLTAVETLPAYRLEIAEVEILAKMIRKMLLAFQERIDSFRDNAE